MKMMRNRILKIPRQMIDIVTSGWSVEYLNVSAYER